MEECKGFNMERLLVKNKNGYMFTGYYKDGLIRADGNEECWDRPIVFDSFILLKDLANDTKKSDKPSINNDVLLARASDMERRESLIAFVNDLKSGKIKYTNLHTEIIVDEYLSNL